MKELIRKISQGYRATEKELQDLRKWNLKRIDSFIAAIPKAEGK